MYAASSSRASSSQPVLFHLPEKPLKAIPHLCLKQGQFRILPWRFQGPLRALDAFFKAGNNIFFTPQDHAQKIKHQEEFSHLQRSLLVTPNEGYYMIFRRCCRPKQKYHGSGGSKRHCCAVDLITGKRVDFCSAFRSPDDVYANVREFEILSTVMGAAIPGSFIQATNSDGWIEPLEAGNLMQARDKYPQLFAERDWQLEMARQMAGQVVIFHERGWLHRDINPTNFLYSIDLKEGVKIRLSDFGLSMKKDSAITDFPGTPFYLSPEFFRELGMYFKNKSPGSYEYATEKHDAWQLGMTFFILFLYGKASQHVYLKDKMDEIFESSKPKLQIHSLIVLWATQTVRQKDWFSTPQDRNCLEFVISQLLQIDPKRRWTPKRAYEYLSANVCNQQKIEKCQKHLIRLKQMVRAKKRGNRRNALQVQIAVHEQRLKELSIGL